MLPSPPRATGEEEYARSISSPFEATLRDGDRALYKIIHQLIFRQLPANELAGMMLASIGGLRLRKKSGHDGQVDGHPCSYVSSCDGVSRARETTADTSKLIPSRSV